MSVLQPAPEDRPDERIAAILDESRSRVARSIDTAMVHAHCVACDERDETKRWAAVEAEHQRVRALRGELPRASRAR